MKRIISALTKLTLCSYVSLVSAQTLKTDDAQLDSIVNELRELGAQQSPDEIDYIPPLTEEEYQDLLEYSNSLSDSISSEECSFNDLDIENSKKLSFSEFLEYNPTIARGTSLVQYLGWSILFVGAILGWFLIKRKRLFIGKMILSSLLPLSLIYLTICLSIDSDLSYFRYASRDVFLLTILFGGILLKFVCPLYGYGTIIFIYKKSENKYRVVWLISSIILCSICPPLFVVPFFYSIIMTENYHNTILYKLLLILCGMLFGVILSIPFFALTGYLGRTIREIIYYLQYLC